MINNSAKAWKPWKQEQERLIALIQQAKGLIEPKTTQGATA